MSRPRRSGPTGAWSARFANWTTSPVTRDPPPHPRGEAVVVPNQWLQRTVAVPPPQRSISNDDRWPLFGLTRAQRQSNPRSPSGFSCLGYFSFSRDGSSKGTCARRCRTTLWAHFLSCGYATNQEASAASEASGGTPQAALAWRETSEAGPGVPNSGIGSIQVDGRALGAGTPSAASAAFRLGRPPREIHGRRRDRARLRPAPRHRRRRRASSPPCAASRSPRRTARSDSPAQPGRADYPLERR